MKILLSFIFISTLLLSCETPKVLPESKMKVLVWNLLKNSYDSSTTSFKFSGKFTDDDLAPLEAVFKENKVSRQDFYFTFESYQQDPSKLKLLMDSVIAFGNRDIVKPKAIKPNTKKTTSAFE